MTLKCHLSAFHWNAVCMACKISRH